MMNRLTVRFAMALSLLLAALLLTLTYGAGKRRRAGHPPARQENGVTPANMKRDPLPSEQARNEQP